MSTTRAIESLKFALIERYTVKSGTTLHVGDRIIFTSTEEEVDLIAAENDFCVGTVYQLGHGATAAGALLGDGTKATQVDVILDGNVIVKMTVGTGGATRGKLQRMSGSSDGITDAPANGGGTTPHRILGIAVNGGVVTDKVGVLLLPCFTGSAT